MRLDPRLEIQSAEKRTENLSANKIKIQATFSQISAASAVNRVDCQGKIAAVGQTTTRDGRIGHGESISDATGHGAEIETLRMKAVMAAVKGGEIGLDPPRADDVLDHPENLRVSIDIDHLWIRRKTANGKRRNKRTRMSWKISSDPHHLRNTGAEEQWEGPRVSIDDFQRHTTPKLIYKWTKTRMLTPGTMQWKRLETAKNYGRTRSNV
jgi:uncharacterized C2H2 Zn-finger protein